MNNVRQVWRNVSRIGRPLRAAIRLPIVAVLLVSTAAFAQDNQRLTLTIYNSDLALVEADGDAIADDELVVSDVILPPRDVSFAEAAAEFTGDGLIPD